LFLILGGPGSGRKELSKRLVARYLGWEHVSLGDALRKTESLPDDKGNLINEIQGVDLVPEVSHPLIYYSLCFIDNSILFFCKLRS